MPTRSANGPRGADRHRPLDTAGLRAGDQLGLLAHGLRHPGAGAGEDHRPAAGRCPAGAGPRSDGLAQHHCLVDATDLRASAARLQRGAPPGAGHPAGTRFYEESTYWNPSWTFAQGAIQTTNIVDLTTTAETVGEGTLLSPESHQEQIALKLIGFGTPVAGCPACHTLDEAYSYGLGVVISGDWILQNPLFGGYGAVAGYLPAQKIAVAVATTFGEGAFDEQGNYRHRSFQDILAAVGTYLAPDHPVPTPTS